MKIFILLITLITTSMSFADCPAGDPNCVMKESGAGTMSLGSGCASCTALEKANTRLDGTSRNFRGNSKNSSKPADATVDVEN